MSTPARHRDDGVRQMNVSLDREAIAWLAQRAPSRRAYGHFLSRLLYQDKVKFEERQRLTQVVQTALDTEARLAAAADLPPWATTEKKAVRERRR